jgi:hypothetical protein
MGDPSDRVAGSIPAGPTKSSLQNELPVAAEADEAAAEREHRFSMLAASVILALISGGVIYAAARRRT